MTPILESLRHLDEIVIWDNYVGGPRQKIKGPQGWIDVVNGAGGADGPAVGDLGDLAVYGRYAAIEHTTSDLIFVQDDDVILTREAIDEIIWECDSGGDAYGRLVCNMPPEFRHDFYQDHALVGFGACFHRDLPTQAFAKWNDYYRIQVDASPAFNRTCDIVFTTLTPFTLVDVPLEHREFAHADNRMWKQKDHFGERMQQLKLARSVLGN